MMKNINAIKTATLSVIIFTLALTSPATMAAPEIMPASCDDYPYTNGMNVEDVNGGIKIISTASAAVSFDDIDAINSARDEATLEAKSYVSKFLSEGVSSDEIINKAVEETKSMQGQSKESQRKEVKESLKKLQNSSQALLRGVVLLGDCYTKGREVRVSVGIKPETINQAGNLANGISKSIESQPANQNGGSSDGSLQGSEGFSNKSRLEKF